MPRGIRVTKAELSARVATRASMFRAGAHTAVDAMFSTIAGALSSGQTVGIVDFGIFSTKSRLAR